ncbi:cadherin domain-containing protein [Dokdonella fugitiva]|uniref:Cadherin domain-containing protein n=2 Tax=Dokdonella fugitiva TaxID=328517 RepID=A0A4R2HWY5_9GAMM|nr:cadherin domain-containing protein [Dokdonella fugitiva]
MNCISKANAKLPSATVLTCAVGVVLAMASSIAHAEMFCVDATAGLQIALDDALSNAEPDEIRIQAGDYILSAGLVYNTQVPGADQHALTISGGYDADCVQRIGVSKLNGNTQVQVIKLVLGAPVFMDHVTIAGGRVENTPGDSGRGGGVFAQLQGSSAELHLDAVRLISNVASGFGGGIAVISNVGGGSHFSLRNSLLAGNVAQGAGGAAIGVVSKGMVDISNNTITANVSDNASAVHLQANDASAQFRVDNNIVWGNGASPSYDLQLVAPPAGGDPYHLVANDIGSTQGMPGDDSDLNVSIDPLFVACAFCSNYPLSAASPLIDAGVGDPAGGLAQTDLLGAARVMGASVDMGAYEFVQPNIAPTVAEDQAFVVDESAAQGAIVGTVTATDDYLPQPHAITYAIVDGNTGDAFAIDADSGVLTVANPDALDSTAMPAYALAIKVTDGELDGVGVVNVTVSGPGESDVIFQDGFDG